MQISNDRFEEMGGDTDGDHPTPATNVATILTIL